MYRHVYTCIYMIHVYVNIMKYRIFIESSMVCKFWNSLDLMLFAEESDGCAHPSFAVCLWYQVGH